MIMQLRDEQVTLSVPVPDHKEIRSGTLRSIIRQSGLPRKLFEVE
jgi:predicted RNA binding protein YcfA (HicA-like mRNA interferase family)